VVGVILIGSIPVGWEVDLIEEIGARIVADATCLGDRVFEATVSETGDPWLNLYDTYIEKNNCPHRRPVTPLFDYLKSLTEKPSAEGIIYRSVKYCHPWGLLGERIKKELSLPILRLDDDLTSPAMSGFRTRIGAFIEMLEARKARRA
jgi:benzoyl-CoA reductase/2-hydroxyglutaryl-CoA dehydratase subunit BcrC/BadD/HgdB